MKRRAVLALLACVACSSEAAPPSSPPEEGWEAIRNPFLEFDDAAIKDAFCVRRADEWHFGYSRITETPFRFRLGFSKTKDFVSFEHGTTIDQDDVGGLASPDVSQWTDGSYVMTYNSHTRDVGTDANKLYWRSSSDLVTWSEPHRFHVEGADASEDRLIDAALAYTDSAAFLFFKREQVANVAVSASRSLDGPWTLLGPIEPGNVENMQVLRIDGTWHLLATTLLPHRPVLHRLEGDPNDAQAWRKWSVVRELEIPEQPWNTGKSVFYERANAGYLVDDRAHDGFFLLVFAGTVDLSSYEGRGHVRLGIARSRDLVTWEVPRSKESAN